MWTPALERATYHAACGVLVDDDGHCPEHGAIAADERESVAGCGYRIHDLRHTCVSRLVAAGADIKLVQVVAGHANPTITLRRYSHLLDGRVTEAAERFDPPRRCTASVPPSGCRSG